jgi:hypothetical protein
MRNTKPFGRVLARFVVGTVAGALLLPLLSSEPAMGISAAPASAPSPASNWTQLTPPASPPELDGASMAYDQATKEMVLFGGFSDGKLSDYTYAYSGSSWVLQDSTTSPPALAFASMAYDPTLGEMVLFGGVTLGKVSSETWYYNGATWTNAGLSGPVACYGAMMTYDPAIPGVLVVGGCHLQRRFHIRRLRHPSRGQLGRQKRLDSEH